MTELECTYASYLDSIEDLDIPLGGDQWEIKKATESQSNSMNRGVSTRYSLAFVNFVSKTK